MPASSTNELKQLIRDYLLNDPGVKELVGRNVFGAHIEDADAGSVLSSSPMVIFELLAGNLRWHGAVAIQTMDVYGYSKLGGDLAGQVYDAVTASLHHTCIRKTGIDITVLCRETQRPLDSYNPVIDAWFVRGRWTMEVS